MITHTHKKTTKTNKQLVGWYMMFNVTFNNISVISWWSVLLVEEKTTDLSQVTDKLYHITLYRVHLVKNIVESDVEHHIPTNQLFVCFCCFFVCVGNHERSNMKNAM
jgi:hypothetical protein